jgi:GNAT superfamily N-acetyltransferase
LTAIVARALVASDHAALLELMARAHNGCFCRWWHHGGDDMSWQARCNLEPQLNRAAMGAALDEGNASAEGVVALAGDALVGWLKLCPAPAMAKLFGRRVYRTLDVFGGPRDDVLIVGCVLVDAAWRRQGVCRAMIEAALGVARARGARAVEAFPRRPRETVRDDEMWMGPPSALLACGFEEIAGPEPYPVLRCVL